MTKHTPHSPLAKNTTNNIPSNISSLKTFGRRCFIIALSCFLIANVNVNKGVATAQAQAQKEQYPFHEALRAQDIDAARRLFVKGGVQLFMEEDPYGMLPLHIAVSAGASQSVNFLIEQGIDPNAKPEKGYSSIARGRSPLHLAVAAGGEQIIAQLLEIGADVFAADNSGATPLHIATQYGHKSIVTLLVKAMGARAHVRDANGTTPLHIAARQGHRDLTALLLFVENEGLRKRVERFLGTTLGDSKGSSKDADRSYLVNIKNSFGLSPLHYAALGGHKEVAKLLLQEGAEINTFNAQGLTPLFLASRDGHEGIVELLSSQQETNLESGDKEAHTPLCISVANGHLQIFARLLRRGANPHAKDKNGMIPLHIAAKRGNVDAVKSLLKTLDTGRGNIDERDNAGNTPLLYAVQTGKGDLVKVLLLAGADASARNRRGETSLDIAQKLGHNAILPILK